MIEESLTKLEERCNWFDLFSTKSQRRQIIFKNNRFHSITSQHDMGTGIRLNRRGKTGFSYTNSSDDINSAIDQALDLAPLGEEEKFSLPEGGLAYPELTRESTNHYDEDVEIQKGQLALDTLLNRFPDIQVELILGGDDTTRHIINSEGVDIQETSTRYRGTIRIEKTGENGVPAIIGESLHSQSPGNLEPLVKKLSTTLQLCSSHDTLRSGGYPVYITPKGLSSLISILLQGLTGRAFYKKISPYEGKLGELLFNPSISIYDNPLLPGSAYSYSFDDEGTPSMEKVLIQQGRITGYITDRKYASLMHSAPSGNGKRGYNSLPTSAFSNIIINSGNTGAEDLISSISKGIVVDKFIGLGQSNTITGDFCANLDLAFGVRHGSITGRIKDTMISGNVFDMFGEDGILLSHERDYVGNTLLPGILFENVSISS